MKHTKKSIIASCDRLWSQIVKKRANGICRRCGAPADSGQAHHAVMKRRYFGSRWMGVNGLWLCPICHNVVEGSRRENELLCNRYLHVGLVAAIVTVARQEKVWSISDLIETERHLKRYLGEVLG